ncbi:hemicentin-2-like [Scylla paramamosain]|uniref:hemicentin-2-like n=1 Tax=Scylla paramamosain TaxID=85552 RepID=UPI003083380A
MGRGVGARMLLGGGGTSLLIRNVHRKDEAEYRCQVHFRLSPTWTQRLLLRVPDRVWEVVLTDREGRPLEGRTVGPLQEGASLDLACQANHGSSEVMSLVWLLEGEVVDATWASPEKGVAINQVTLSNLREEHRNAQLTCRLTSRDPQRGHVSENITDASTMITMYYVPEAELVVEGGHRSGGGGGREVEEGRSVSFLCSVRADPPAYNITWLHNGRVMVVGGRRWRRDNASLVVTPVRREDAGLYTCLASNIEGDGHSNAVQLRVAHTPYCSGRPHKHLVVSSQDNVTLTCQVEAVPDKLDFTWRLVPPPATPPSLKGAVGARIGGQGVMQ